MTKRKRVLRAAMTAPAIVALLLTTVFVASVRAQPSPPSGASGARTQPGNDFNFELTTPGESKPELLPSPEQNLRLQKLEQRVHLRRQMLVWHQIFGFITLAALAATDIIGTLNYVDEFGGGKTTGAYQELHIGLAAGSSLTFATTAALALFAPNPYPKPIKLDVALLHKMSMALAAACFVAQIILGPIAANANGKSYQHDILVAHIVTGWSAFGFMSTGTIAYMVK